MSTKVKIKIQDNNDLRSEIDEFYESIDQINAAKWSLSIAEHILEIVDIDYKSLEIVDIDYKSIDEIVEGFKINEMWQVGEAKVKDVRKSGFNIHKIARECNSEIKRTALRVVGHAVASAHMKEHAMVASDYAVKTIGLIYPNNMEAITLEREWQLNEIRKLL